MGKGTAEEQLVERYRDELANERAAHAEAERLLSAERAALEVSRAKVLDLEMRAVEAERLLTEAREQRQQSLTAASRAAGEIIEARDRLSRVKAAVDALRAAWFPISGEDAARYRDHMGAIERALAGVVSAPTSTFTFGRFVSGHVQRLRDGTWEWCHDGGFDYGVIDLAPDVCAFLSSVAGPPRPVLTEDRAREMAEEAIEASMNRSTVVLRDNMAALLLRISRGDFGEAHREPAAEHQPGCAHGGCDLCNGEPRTDLAALADAIEANGRTWQRVEPSTVAQALRAVDRRMRTLEATVTALAASVEQVQTKAGIGEPRVVDVEGGVNGPMRVRRPDPQDEGEAGDDCPPSCTNPDPNHRHPALRAKRLADEQRTRLHEGDPAAKVAGPWTLDDEALGIWKRRTNVPDDHAGSVRIATELVGPWWVAWSDVAPEGVQIASGTATNEDPADAFTRCDAALVSAGWTLTGGIPEQFAKPASPRQGDVVPGLVLGHIDGQPIRARYTGVTPTEPRKP